MYADSSNWFPSKGRQVREQVQYMGLVSRWTGGRSGALQHAAWLIQGFFLSNLGWEIWDQNGSMEGSGEGLFLWPALATWGGFDRIREPLPYLSILFLFYQLGASLPLHSLPGYHLGNVIPSLYYCLGFLFFLCLEKLRRTQHVLGPPRKSSWSCTVLCCVLFVPHDSLDRATGWNLPCSWWVDTMHAQLFNTSHEA